MDRFFDPRRRAALVEGAVWDRKRGNIKEKAVKILRIVRGEYGQPRYLIEGLETGRQWFVNQHTLVGAYTPRNNERLDK